jgi:hypothetical protein
MFNFPFAKLGQYKLAIVAFCALAIVLGGIVPSFAATSFSVDSTNLMDSAASIFNALWPAFALVVGIALGLGLLTLLVTEIRKAI